jgi:RNA polymerase sigma factor (TIGR02999 family)
MVSSAAAHLTYRDEVLLAHHRCAMAQPPDVTALLAAWSNGDPAVGSTLMDAVYSELRRLARGYLRRERRDHSLPPTALVHEAYLKLVDQRRVRWQSRAHFFAIAAHVMRRVLVDHARAHGAAKRGAGARVPLQDIDASVEGPDIEILALDAALDRLAAIDQRRSQLVELRFFGGLTVDETAVVLGVAPITVKRDWALARAWLYRELRGQAE